ncbi:MAG: tetratricopeptide repeat protein [Bacteroidales bacterium]|nr:tetratricopeptide repeat protein [Bacteroidales bacterium]
MKKIFTIIAIAASMFAVSAQAQNVKSLSAAKAALDKAQAAAENPKQNTKLATWLKYGQSLMDAYAAPSGNMWVGMTAQDLALVAAGERQMSESQVEVNGQAMTKRAYANKNLYFNEAGQVAVIEVTQPLAENILDKALEAFTKAAELDPKGSKTKDISAGLESVASKYMDEAYNAYTLGKPAAASIAFEKAAKASATAPLNKVDDDAVYNAGFTAWQAQDWDRAKKFFEQGIAKGYYGEDGESFAKLADIADKQGDKAASKAYLEEGFQKAPQSQSILIGLINYYLNNDEDPGRLFDLFDVAKKNEPDNASLYYVEGNARLKLNQYEEALAAYDKASEVNPKYEWGYVGKGMALYNRAVELQEQASLEVDDAKYMALLGEFESVLKSCIEPFETAIELTTDDEVKISIAEYLKNAFFRFRSKGDEYQQKYEKYAAIAEGK